MLRKNFKHGPSPSIEACEALTGVPPIDIYCESIAVKFAIKISQNDDLVRDIHLKAINKSRRRANSLESSLKRYSRFINKETILEYTKLRDLSLTNGADDGREGLTTPSHEPHCKCTSI